MSKPFIDAEKSKQVEKVLLDAEIEIKLLIRDNTISNGISNARDKIAKIIENNLQNLPKEIVDIDRYKQILFTNATIWQMQFSRIITDLKALTVNMLRLNGFTDKIPSLVNAHKMTPEQLYKVMIKVGEQYKTIGTTSAFNYPKQLRRSIRKLGGTSADVVTIGKRKTRLISKIELDLRHDHQIKMIEDKKASGHDLYWITTHSSCSERCEKWQGKIVSLTLPSINEHHETGHVVNSHTVYSLNSIINQIDKYGYKNNVIVGFNCRHGLVQYYKGDNPPTIYSDREIEYDRKVNAKMRSYENTIRTIKKQAVMTIDNGERRMLKAKARALTIDYKRFAQDNQIAYYEWRLAL